MIRQLKRNDEINFLDYCLLWDIPNPLRLFNKIRKWGVKCSISHTRDIDGMLIAKKENKKVVLEIYTKQRKIASNLIKQFIWSSKETLYISLPANSNLIKILLRLGFKIYSKRNSPTVDLIRQFDKKYYFKKKVNNHD